MSAITRRRRTRHIVAGTLVGSLAIAFAATAPALAGESFDPKHDDPICEEELFQQFGTDGPLLPGCEDPKDPKDPKDPEDPKDPKDPKDPEDPEDPKDPKDPPVTPPVTPPATPPVTPPVVPPVVDPVLETSTPVVKKAAKPRLALFKKGPKRTRAGQIANWRIQVTNRGRGTARGVLLQDVVPSGFALVRTRVRVGSGKNAKWVKLRYRIANGRVMWKLGNLPKGARRNILVSMRSTSTTAGRRCNVALLTAKNHRTLRDRACIAVKRIQTKVLPAVTG